MSDGAMSPVIQETEELSPNSSILFDSDSSCASLGVAQNTATTGENGSVESMAYHEELFSASDTEADSAISIVKCLNSASPSSSLVTRRNDNSAIIRLNNELLKAKRSNWEVVDALGKAYQDIKDLRLREQRLNAVLSNCSSKHGGTNGFAGSLALPDSKIIELQLALRREEAVKTREDLRALIEERDKLKEKLGRSESDRRLVSFTRDQRERELELSQSHINDLAANIREKDEKILSVQDKLIVFEKEMKAKDEELCKTLDEKNALRAAVIRSEQEIEALSEKLQNVLLSKEENAKRLFTNADQSLGIQTIDPAGKVLGLNGQQVLVEDTRLAEELRYFESRHEEDVKVIHELSSQLKEWESIVKSMNDFVQDTNQQQLEARKEIADYVKMLEQRLREAKKGRKVSVKDQGCSVQENHWDSTKATQQHDTINENMTADDCPQQPGQVEELNQSANVNFEDYLKCSSEYEEESDLKDDTKADHEPFTAEFENTIEPEDISFDYCLQSSVGHLVQPDEVRMARVVPIEGFAAQTPTPKMTTSTSRDSKTRVERPARKASSGKRRKLPQVTRKASLESEPSTLSATSQSDETLSITSFESQVSRDTTDMRRVSREGSGRRLPQVPSKEEMHVIKTDVSTDKPVSQLPGVMSIYHKGPTYPNGHRQDSGLGDSVNNSPALPGHKFSISNLRRKFSKEKTNPGSQDVDGNNTHGSKKGLFQGKLCLGKTKRRKNSVGTMSSVSDSFRTVTPLNSDEDCAAGFADESFDGGSLPSSIKTSTPKKGNVLKKKGDVNLQSKLITAQRRRAALLLVFQYLNPVELCGLARVCREWRAMSEHPALWKQVTLEEIPLNNMALQAISRRCSRVQFLKLKGLKKIKSKEKSQTLTATEDKRCYLEKGLEFLLKAAGSSLLSLHIEDCGIFITDRCLSLAGCHCRELQQLVYISDSFPACPEALWALWACRKLLTLRVPPMFPCDHPGRFNDKSLETIANCWPNMRHLSVGGPSLSSTGLIHIAKGCLRLQELEVDRTIAISEEIAHAMCLCGLRGLETISFTFTPVSPGAIKELLGACPRLERIEVHIGISDYFMNVDDDVSKRKYSRIVKKLAALKQENQEFARVLWIKADYG